MFHYIALCRPVLGGFDLKIHTEPQDGYVNNVHSLVKKEGKVSN